MHSSSSLLLPAAIVLAQLLGCQAQSEAGLLASAKSFISSGKPADAAIELRRALQINASSTEARLLFGKLLLANNDPSAAEVELRKALELGANENEVLPDLARAMLTQGQGSKLLTEFATRQLSIPQAQAQLRTWVAAAYAQTGNPVSARAEIAAALNAQPSLASAAIVQARLKADAGDIDGALLDLSSVLATDPLHEEAAVARAYLLWLGKGDALAAIQAHREVLAKHPNSLAAQSEIVGLLFQQGQTDAARKEFETLQKIAPLHPQTQFFQAQFAYVDRQFARARELTDVLLKMVPDHVRALELAAASEFHLGNDAQAQMFLGRALKLVPGLVLSRQILAQSLARTGEPAKVIEALLPLTEAAQPDAQSLVLAGNAWTELGEWQKAEAAYTRARAAAPKDAKVRTDIALSMLGGPRDSIALEELKRLAADEGGPRADLALVSGLIARKDYAAALKAIDGLQTSLPKMAFPQQLRGQVQLALRDAAGARRSFETALTHDPKYFPAVAALASMDVVMGQVDKARQRVEEFLSLVPNHVMAYTLLAEIPGPPGAGDTLTDGLRKAARANPGDAKSQLTLVGRLLAVGERREALEAAQQASVALPQDMSVLESLGQTQLLAGELRQAVSSFKRLTIQQPGRAQAQMLLGEAHVAGNELDEARRAFAKAAELDPSLGEASRALAMIEMRQGRVEAALAMARAMQKSRPADALGWAVEGDIEVQRRNFPAAAAAFKTTLAKSAASEAAIKLHATLLASSQTAQARQLEVDWESQRPNDPAFRFHLGDVAMREKQWETAEGHYRAVLKGQPANGSAMNNIAWLLNKQAKPGALAMAERANAATPRRAPILDTLASLQAAEGQMQKAIDTQRLAVAASAQDLGLHLTLARYLAKGGLREEARQLLESLARQGDKFPAQAEVANLLKTL